MRQGLPAAAMDCTFKSLYPALCWIEIPLPEVTEGPVSSSVLDYDVRNSDLPPSDKGRGLVSFQVAVKETDLYIREL